MFKTGKKTKKVSRFPKRTKIIYGIAVLALVLSGGYVLAKKGSMGSVSADTITQPNMPRMQMMAIKVQLFNSAPTSGGKIWVTLLMADGWPASGSIPDDEGSVNAHPNSPTEFVSDWTSPTFEEYIMVPSTDYITSDVFYNKAVASKGAYYHIVFVSNSTMCKSTSANVPVGSAGSVATATLDVTCDFSSMMKNVMKGMGNVFTPPPTAVMNPIPPTTTPPVFTGPTIQTPASKTPTTPTTTPNSAMQQQMMQNSQNTATNK